MAPSISFQTQYEAIYKPLLDLENCPEVHLRHFDGGHMERGNLLSPNLRTSGKPDAFVMIPITSADNNLSFRNDDELAGLRYAGQVAIAYKGKDELRYISCRQKVPILGSTLAEYRNKIGNYEVFQVEYSFQERSYSFKAHNELYLHYNSRLRTVAFKPVDSTVAKWRVSEFADADGERFPSFKSILFVGVVKAQNETKVVGESIANEEKFDRDHFEYVMKLLRQEGASFATKCAIFQLPDVNQQWIVTTDSDGISYIVVTTAQFPTYLAVECIDDLAALFGCKYKPLFEEDKIPSKIEQERMAKEIYATHMEYESSVENPSKGDTVRLEKDLGEIKDRMTKNIDNLLSNIESGESLLAKTDDILKDAEIFKKRAKKLKKKTRNKLAIPALVAVVGGAAGGIGGWLVGGPVGAAYLGSQTAEIGAGVGLGIAGCSVLHSYASNASPFWSNTFVYVSRSLIKKSSMRTLQAKK